MRDLSTNFQQVLGAIISLWSTVDALPQDYTAAGTGGKKVVSFADVFGGGFAVSRTSLQWTSQGTDGNFVDQNDAGDLVFENIVSGNSSVFVAASDIDGAAKNFSDYTIQPSG